MRIKTTLATLLLTAATLVGMFLAADLTAGSSDLAQGFISPPQSAKPMGFFYVYWPAKFLRSIRNKNRADYMI